MRKYIYLIICVALLSGCLNNDFLERYPLGDPTAETAFETYDNFKAYAWGLYATFPALGYGTENATDDISYNLTKGNSESNWIKGNVTIPDGQSGTSWSYYSYIRRVNLMLDHIDGSKMSDMEKEHWRSVGYFFRSYRYFSLLSDYGGVPWIDHVLSDDETELIQGPRDSRDVIAQHILENLQYAEKNIKADGDGANTINKACVQALLSRFCLFEGTWRKYHKLDNADIYLKECKRTSRELINSMPDVTDCYDDLFGSLELSGVKGIILYKEYSNAAGVVHATSRTGVTAAAHWNPTRDLVDSYLCSDGKPRWSSELFQGEEDIYDEFACRDHRLWLHVTPPYRVTRTDPSTAFTSSWEFTGNPKDQSYMDSLRIRVGVSYGSGKERQKTLPFRQGYSGGILGTVPHYSFYTENQAWYVSKLGYNNWKFFNCYLEMGSQQIEETDMPIFRIEEVMLNYAEAMCELNEFDQDIADITINKLRPRANVAPMKVSEINAAFDEKRDKGNTDYPGDYEVNPLLWEIRRERRIELFCENFRFNDLRRWKKCHYALKKKLGQYVRKSDFPNGAAVTIDGGGTEGYLEFHPKPNHLWPDYYYLNPIPRNERVLNPQLEQNPGWEEEK